VDFRSMMVLEEHDRDVFVGVGPQYPWGGLYGGQIVAQGLRAAANTVEEHFRVHSLHAYFIRGGDHTEPIRFEVDRQRNGRSFVTRRVVARQAVGAILTMSLSFQVDEAGHDVQIESLPDVPRADAVADSESWSPMFDRRFTSPRAAVPGKATAWMRMTEPLGDDPVLQACALAYLSDDLPTDAVVGLHPDVRSAEDDDVFHQGFMSASLDHAIWFHRPLDAEAWHVHDFASHAYLSSRGLAVGHVLTQQGVHVATIAQEVLLRKAD
jgi:acyl-CoA thioesterase-2